MDLEKNQKSAISMLDIKDKRVLRELFANARTPLSTIGKRTGLSQEVVKYRIERLVKNSFILRFNTVLDASKLGWEIHFVYIRMKNTTPEKEKKIISKLINHPNVAQCIECIGNYDIVLKLFTKNTTHANEIVKDIEVQIKPHLDEYIIDHVMEETPIPLPFLYAPLDPSKQRRVAARQSKRKQNKQFSYDTTDLRILQTLAHNARMPISEISKRLNESRDVVKYRLKRLETNNVILKYRPSLWLGTAAIGFNWFFVMIRTEKLDPKTRNTIGTYLTSCPQLTYVYQTIGTYDICFEVRLMKSNTELNELLGEIKMILKDSFKRYELSIILNEHKYTYFPDCLLEAAQ